MRIVTGATELCSIAKLYENTGWETLQSRRNKQKLQKFYKMVHGLAPSYLNKLVPPLLQENSQYSPTNAINIQTLQCNANLFYNSFLPSAVRGWNSLSDDLRNTPSFSVFKSKLYAERNKPPSYYNHVLRTLQVYHTILGLECSSLNSPF